MSWHREWYYENREHVREYRRARRLENPQYFRDQKNRIRANNKECVNARERDNRKKEPWRYLFYAINQRCSNSKNLSFKYYGGKGVRNFLTIEDIKFLWHRDRASEMEIPTIDREHSNGDYILSNCRFIEKRENSRRKTMSEEAKAKLSLLYTRRSVEL